MAELFDMKLRAKRRDRAARNGPALFLFERALEDCLERLAPMRRRFKSALLIGCPDPAWRGRISAIAEKVAICDPGPLFADRVQGQEIVEDRWQPGGGAYDLIISIGTLDTVNGLPLALRLLHHALRPGGVLIGAFSGGDTLPSLRAAMRAADQADGVAAAHVHPRIEPASFTALMGGAGFASVVVDVDRAAVSYASFSRLVGDLRAMGASNVLTERARRVGRAAQAAARSAFESAGKDGRTTETFEILHFIGFHAGQS